MAGRVPGDPRVKRVKATAGRKPPDDGLQRLRCRLRPQQGRSLSPEHRPRGLDIPRTVRRARVPGDFAQQVAAGFAAAGRHGAHQFNEGRSWEDRR